MLSVTELMPAGREYIHQGFMPRLYDENVDPTRLYRSYFQTYIERDIRQMINIRRLTDFEHFMRLLAGRIGQILNLNALSSDLRVSSTTLKEWLSVLEASHAGFRLNPYYAHFGKCVIKSLKVYFTDVGLASFLPRKGPHPFEGSSPVRRVLTRSKGPHPYCLAAALTSTAI